MSYNMTRYDMPAHSLDANPAVAILNCAPFWRRFGLRCGRHVWIVKDVCGIICCVITYMLILYATFVVMCVIMPSSHGSWLNFVNGFIFYVFAGLAFASHVRTVVTDPSVICYSICSECKKTTAERFTPNLFRRVVQCCYCITYRMPSSRQRTCSDTCVNSQSGPRLRRKKAVSARIKSGVSSETGPTILAKTQGLLVARLWEHLWTYVTKLAPDTSHIYFLDSTRGMVLVVLTWLVLVGSEILMILFVFLPIRDYFYDVGNVAVSLLLAFLVGVSHLRTMFTDPGAIPRGNATDENIRKLGLRDGQVVFKCPKCVSIKPERAHHCSVCRRCIKKMDHHCPWVNNCVGENNQKYFVLFTMYICLMSFHALYMAIQKFITCATSDWRDCSNFSAPATTIFLIMLLFEALLFAMFTAIMFGTQMSSICSDETGIEQLKSEYPTWEKKSWWLSMKAVFGHPFSFKWFSPFHIPIIGKDQVYLYNV